MYNPFVFYHDKACFLITYLISYIAPLAYSIVQVPFDRYEPVWFIVFCVGIGTSILVTNSKRFGIILFASIPVYSTAYTGNSDDGLRNYREIIHSLTIEEQNVKLLNYERNSDM